MKELVIGNMLYVQVNGL